MLALKKLKRLVAVLDADCIWRWMHSGEIIAHTLTDQDTGDAFRVEPLLGQIGGPTGQFTADGAYGGKPTYDAVINHSAAAHPARTRTCGTRTAANVDGLEMKKVLQKLNRTPTTFALEPPCMSPSVPQAPDRWCIRQKKSTSGMALKERFNSGPR